MSLSREERRACEAYVGDVLWLWRKHSGEILTERSALGAVRDGIMPSRTTGVRDIPMTFWQSWCVDVKNVMTASGIPTVTFVIMMSRLLRKSTTTRQWERIADECGVTEANAKRQFLFGVPLFAIALTNAGITTETKSVAA